MALGVVLVAAMPLTSDAAPPDSIPAECKAQLQTALRAIEPVVSAKARKIARGSKGTLESAVASYGPPRYHAVEEGAIAAPKPGAKCPSDMANVGDRFCVDKYEGSLLARGEGGTLTPHPHNELLETGRVYVARSVAGVFPQGYISAAAAQSACREAKKRLCHPAEWRAACGGSEAYAFPYGPVRIEKKCRDSGTPPMLHFHAESMKRGWGMTELNDPRLLKLDNTIVKTGESKDCVTDQGVYDMVGNLHEWTADPNGTFQGGYFLDTAQHGDGCAYRTISHGFNYHDYSTGFRCCADPAIEP